MTDAQAQEVVAKWAAWMEKVGPARSDVGAPFGPSTSLVDDGTVGAPPSLSGYSIVEAADLSAARSLAQGHSYLADGKGEYAIDIFEMMPAPFDT